MLAESNNYVPWAAARVNLDFEVIHLNKNGAHYGKIHRKYGHLIEAGVDGIFTVGTAGEFWALSIEEKKRIYQGTVAAAKGRVPVYLGTGANTTREAVRLAELAQEAGADCLSVLTPNFINPSPEELFRPYRAIARAVDLPVLLYTNPDRTGVGISADLAVRLAEEVDNIAGIKDSSGDLGLTAEYLRRTPDEFHVLMGRDTLIYAGLAQGAAGAIAASANIAPELSVGIFENFVWGDMNKALDFQQRLAPLRLAFGLGTFPAMLKAGAELLGLPAGPPRAPVGRLSAAQRQQLREVLVQMGKIEAGRREPVVEYRETSGALQTV
ncbi:MAG: dihydrodipicolinate synthase family protein [Candidatus Handelsmanbacteria bacterium]|nr:dihydrodipicolinate synthase family protein [Candidatus Handelsmanbacteria bacterium]